MIKFEQQETTKYFTSLSQNYNKWKTSKKNSLVILRMYLVHVEINTYIM